MVSSILFMILGAILALVAVVVVATVWSAKAVRNGHFASARYDVKSKEWRVCGQFAGIAQKLADIRNGRQPGAIKYVD
jgi:hypothetical protein